jgi:ATP-binding cassette, subfamily B, bacterial PglK
VTVAGKLWYMLAARQRWHAVTLVALILVSVALETLSIGLVVPALAVMTDGNLAGRYGAIGPWLARLGNPSQQRLVVVGVLTLLAIYVVKGVFLAFLAWRQARFAYELQANLSQRLFAGYLRQPYVFHLQRNSAQLIRNTGQASDVTFVVKEGLTLLAEVLVLVGISVLMIVLEPVGALVVVVTLGLAGGAFNALTRGHVLRWGQAQQRHEGLRIQHLQQGFGGAKDVKLLGRESDFVAQYAFHSSEAARITERITTVAALPRLMLEVLAIAGLTALVFVMLGQGKPLQALIPTLGLFVAVAFRVMPSVNRVLGGLQSVRFSVPVINTLYAEVRLLDAAVPATSGSGLALTQALTLDQVHFQYPGAGAAALTGISLTILQGTTVGFIGGSGAGKSTLVDVILGLLTPASGRIAVDGVDIQSDLRGWQDQIGYVPQAIFLTDDTLRRNVAFGVADTEIDDHAVRRAIRAAKLDEFIDELPEGIDTIVGERGVRLSGGQRQRIGIARALYHDPAVLVLDEATSSLDMATERGIMEAIQAFHGSKTVIVVAHRLSTVEGCDFLYRIERSRIVDQGPGAIVLSRVHATAGLLPRLSAHDTSTDDL